MASPMRTIPKNKIQYSDQNLLSFDENLQILRSQPEQSEQFQFISKGVKPVSELYKDQKYALSMMRNGTNLLALPPINGAVEDAQILYSTQMFNDVFAKSLSSLQVPDAYDNLNSELREYDKQAILKQEEFRRAIISISTAWNSLGVYRSDFTKSDNDKMARNAYVAMVEKAFLDYIGSVKWDVTDRETNERIDTAYQFMRKPNPQGSFRDTFSPAIRDLFRYDAGAIVKTFNRRMELIEMRPYLGTEFWIEMDRVPQVISVPTNDNIGIRATEFTSEKTPGKEVLMQGWWSRGFAWRYWQRSQTGVYIPYTPSEVMYMALYKRSDDIYGTDYLKFLKYWVQYLIDSTVAAGKTFQNGMIPSIIFTHPNMHDIDQVQQRITQLRYDNQGPIRTGNAMHLIGQETAQTIAQKLNEMEWVEGQKWVAQLIWGYFGFPSDEFVGGDNNRAVAYVHRNVTKSRLLKPMMQFLEDKINTEVLPFLKGYEDTWEFHFVQELELDDKQKVAQIGSIRMSTISTGLNVGIPARIAYKLSMDETLSKKDLEELDAARENMQMQESMDGMGGDDSGQDGKGDNDQGRYGAVSESYQPLKISDYGQGGENTEQRFGNAEEKEYQKASPQYEVGDTFYKNDKKYEIISNNGEFAKARIYVKDIKDVPKGRSYKVGSRRGVYYIGTLSEKQNEPPAKMRHPTRQPEPKNGNGGGQESGSPASATTGPESQNRSKIPEQPHDTPFSDEGNQKISEHFEKKLTSDVLKYGESQCDTRDKIIGIDKTNLKPYSKYLGHFYGSMNELERNGKLRSTQEFTKKIESINNEFTSVIDKAPQIPEGITLWRGVPLDLKLNIGDVYEDKGFQSHTLEPKRAFGFSSSGAKKTIFRAITDGKAKGIYTNVMREKEVTMQKGTKWKVLDIKQMNKNISVVTVIAA